MNDGLRCYTQKELDEAVQAARIHCAQIAEQWAYNYPLDVWPPPKPGCSVDRYSAQASRHSAKMIAQNILELNKSTATP